MPHPHHSEAARQQLFDFVTQLCPGAEEKAIRAGSMLLRVAHALYQLHESSLADAGLSFAQYRLLMDLLFSEQFQACEGLNPSRLSERQGVSRNTVSALVRNLEEEGLVRRELDEGDRRRFIIALTDKGRALVRAHAGHHFQTVNDLFSLLSTEEKESLIAILEKLKEEPRLNLTGV